MSELPSEYDADFIVQVVPTKDHRKPKVYVIVFEPGTPTPDAEAVRSLLVAGYQDLKYCLTTDQVCRLGDAVPVDPPPEPPAEPSAPEGA